MENSEFNPLDHFAVRRRASEIRAEATRAALKRIGNFARGVGSSAIEVSRVVLRSAHTIREYGNPGLYVPVGQRGTSRIQ